MLRRVSRSFVEHVQSTASPSARSLEEHAESLAEYGSAIELVAAKKYTEAASQFQKCLVQLESDSLYGQPPYNFVLQRLAMTHRFTSNFSACEAALEQIVRNYRVIAADYPGELSTAYAQLALQYLQSNVTKAVQLCSLLLTPAYSQTLDRAMHKDLHFFLGVSATQTGYLLHGGYFPEAKYHLETCLKMNPESRSCFVLHNLAVAQWWHSVKYSQTPDGSEEHSKAVLEFTECVPNFQKAIQLLENLDEPYLPSDLPLKVKATGLSLTNVAEVLFNTGRDAVRTT
jgi:tetratricopeptide (TPR) repeat protein